MSNKEVKEDVALRPSKLFDATYKIKTLSCVIPHGTTIEQVLNPSFWKHNCNMLQPRTQILCEFEDGTRFLWLIVLSSGDTWAKVDIILDKVFGETAAADAISMKQDDDKEFDVIWNGPANRFCVIRTKDKEIIQKGLQQKEDAIEWMAQYKASLSK